MEPSYRLQRGNVKSAHLTSPGCVAGTCIWLASKHHWVVTEDESSGTSHRLGEAASVVRTLARLAMLSGLGAVLHTDGPDPIVPSGCHFVPSSRVHPLVDLNPSGVYKLRWNICNRLLISTRVV